MQQPVEISTQAIQEGDRTVFDELYARLAPRVRGYLQRLHRGDRSAAEDTTQDVFLAAYKGRQKYKGGVHPIAWLLGIARRRWRDSARSAPPEPSELPEATAHSVDVEAQVVRAAWLEGCLDQIDPSARDAIMLVFGEGRTYAEAAEILGEPIGTVKWRVHSASRRLRVLLYEDDTEGI